MDKGAIFLCLELEKISDLSIIISIRLTANIFVSAKAQAEQICFVWGGCHTYADFLLLPPTLILGIQIVFSNTNKEAQEKDKTFPQQKDKHCIKNSL